MQTSLVNSILSGISTICYLSDVAMQEMYAYMRKDGSFREFDFSRKSSTW